MEYDNVRIRGKFKLGISNRKVKNSQNIYSRNTYLVTCFIKYVQYFDRFYAKYSHYKNNSSAK